MVVITVLDKQSLIYVKPIGISPKLVLLEEGDILIMKLDIPHTGAENMTDIVNLRLHTFVKVVHLDIELVEGFINTKYNCNTVPTIKWNKEEYIFKM